MDQVETLGRLTPAQTPVPVRDHLPIPMPGRVACNAVTFEDVLQPIFLPGAVVSTDPQENQIRP